MKGAQELFDRYYHELEKYAQAQTGGSGGSDSVDLARWSRIISTLSPYLKPHSRILDIGTGKGGLLMALRSKGYENLYAIEPSETCRSLLDKQQIPNYPNIASAIEAGHTFDCILCCQVLEHVCDLSGFLKNTHELVAEGGLLYADVPDASRYGVNDYASFYYFDREHINHFTPTSLQRLFTANWPELAVIQAVRYEEAAVATQKMKSYGVSILCKNQPFSQPFQIGSDLDVQAITNYCRSSALDENYASLLQIAEKNVFLWGMGYFLRRIMRKGVFKDLSIAGIIDRDKGGHGLTFAGQPVYPPSKIMEYETNDVCVIITSVLYSEQIRCMLSNADFHGRIIDITRKSHATKL
jgi:SAM-dependent methyltransferase